MAEVDRIGGRQSVDAIRRRHASDRVDLVHLSAGLGASTGIEAF